MVQGTSQAEELAILIIRLKIVGQSVSSCDGKGTASLLRKHCLLQKGTPSSLIRPPVISLE